MMMKKVLSLILALVLCLPLCACGTTTSKNKTTTSETIDMKDAVIGTWKSYYKSPATGDTISATIELYKGGTGKIYWYNVTEDDENSNISLSWEIKDDVINITYDLFGVVNEGYEYDYEADKLTSVDGSRIFDRQ